MIIALVIVIIIIVIVVIIIVIIVIIIIDIIVTIIVIIVGIVQADNTSKEIKWKSLLKQEIFFKSYKSTDLKYYREHLQVKNSSWSGAVTGFLYDEIASNI